MEAWNRKLHSLPPPLHRSLPLRSSPLLPLSPPASACTYHPISSHHPVPSQIKCNIHYFEDGNVQLEDTGKYSCELPLDNNVGEAFAKKVAQFEAEWVGKMEEVYQTLSEQVLQSLRRRLPITRTKFDWEKHAVAKLAMDLQNQAMKK